MKVSATRKTLLCLALLFISMYANAGIDYSRYDDAPVFFLGWGTSFKFAIGAAFLFGLSWILTENNKDENGNVDGGIGSVISLINIGMIICVICSYYLLLPLYLIYTLIKK